MALQINKMIVTTVLCVNYNFSDLFELQNTAKRVRWIENEIFPYTIKYTFPSF